MADIQSEEIREGRPQMIEIVVDFEPEGGGAVWPDIIGRGRHIIHLGQDAPPIRFSGLKGGMMSGDASIAIRIDIDTVVAETSLKLLVAAVELLHARLHGS